MSRRSLLSPLLALALAACSGRGDHPLGPAVPGDPAGISERVEVEGVPLILETYLWRDFMPIAPPDGQPLVAILRVRAADGSPLPAGLAIPSASVYYQGWQWASAPQESPATGPSLLEAVARGGPKWGPGVTVDVVVRLARGGSPPVSLRASNQFIHRTD